MDNWFVRQQEACVTAVDVSEVVAVYPESIGACTPQSNWVICLRGGSQFEVRGDDGRAIWEKVQELRTPGEGSPLVT